jgi:hypothetical protein
MSLSVRSHIVFMMMASVVAWISWLSVLLMINPDEAPWWGFGLFFVTLFLSLFGSFAVAGFTLRTILSARRSTTRYRRVVSLRQSFLWSLALIIALALQGQRILNLWILVLLLVIFAVLELTIVSIEREKQSH